MLSGTEIVNQINAGRVPTNILCYGLKQRLRTNSSEEIETIQNYHMDLRRSLSAKHISRISDRSVAELFDNGKIHLRKKLGKWQSHGKEGFSNMFEALHLMHNNQLALYHEDVIVSIEKASCLLFCKKKSSSTSEGAFHIYSHLNKTGFKVNEHNSNGTFHETFEHKIHIWKYFSELMGSTHTEEVSNEYAAVKASMERTIGVIKNQQRIPGTLHTNRNSHLDRLNGRLQKNLNDFMVLNDEYRRVFEQLSSFRTIHYSHVAFDDLRPILYAFSDKFEPGKEHAITILRGDSYRKGPPSIQRAFTMFRKDSLNSKPIFIFITQEESFFSFVYRYL